MNTSFTTMKRHFDTIHKTPNCMSSSFHYHPHPTNQQMLNYQIICDQQMFCWNNVQRWELTKELKAQSYKLALIIHALIESWLFFSTDCLPVTISTLLSQTISNCIHFTHLKQFLTQKLRQGETETAWPELGPASALATCGAVSLLPTGWWFICGHWHTHAPGSVVRVVRVLH